MDAPSETPRHEPAGGEDGVARQDVLVAIVAAVTGASRDQILEEFALYPGRLRDFKEEVLAAGPLWSRLTRVARRFSEPAEGP